MPISVKCTSCQSSFWVSEEYAGRRARCTKCKAILDVPTLPPSKPQVPVKRRKPSQRAADSEDPTAARLRQVLDAFDGDFEPIRTTLSYRLGIFFVTGAMLLLPVLYLVLIGLAVWFVGWYAVFGLAIVKGAHNVWAVVFGYAGPLIAGVILIFFMIKPLFAGSPRAGWGRTLRLGQEPVLFTFVAHIARTIGAPEPTEIKVDCDANASASFGGGLGGLFGDDLVLTIGLPLAAGLTARQLAGVLAHELGHFTQGAGMRLSYIIRSINAWFVRVVFERDQWDEALVNWCEETGRLALIFYLARLCVALTRAVLWVLMVVGHAISCFLMRQMEYHADRYEARVAGSRAFEETMQRLPILVVSCQAAYAVVAACRHKGKYPNNLATVVLGMAETMPARDRRRIAKESRKAATGLFDTHPSESDRCASVRDEDPEGIFHLDEPASVLFQDFPRLAEETSLAFYRRLFGKRRVLPTDLFPVTEGSIGWGE